MRLPVVIVARQGIIAIFQIRKSELNLGDSLYDPNKCSADKEEEEEIGFIYEENHKLELESAQNRRRQE